MTKITYNNQIFDIASEHLGVLNKTKRKRKVYKILFDNKEKYVCEKNGKIIDFFGHIDYIHKYKELGSLEICKYIKQYILNGQTHREDGGPAYEDFEGKYWVVYNNQHRLDGPAVEYWNGNKEYWINGRQYKNEKEFLKEVDLVKNNKIINLNNVPCLILKKHDGIVYYYDWDKEEMISTNEKVEVLQILFKQKECFLYKITCNNKTGYCEFEGRVPYIHENNKIGELEIFDYDNYNFAKYYLLDDLLHRLNGPAVEHANLYNNKYYVEGIQYETQSDYLQAVQIYKTKNNIP